MSPRGRVRPAVERGCRSGGPSHASGGGVAMHARPARSACSASDDAGRDMKPDREVLAELGVFLDLEPEEEDIAAAGSDRLSYPCPPEHHAPAPARHPALDLE